MNISLPSEIMHIATCDVTNALIDTETMTKNPWTLYSFQWFLFDQNRTYSSGDLTNFDDSENLHIVTCDVMNALIDIITVI